MAQCIDVIVRARPPVDFKIETEDNAISIDADKAQVSVFRRKAKKYADFKFSKVFTNSQQQDVYDAVNVIRYITEGISGCILAYGQTNTGGYHTVKTSLLHIYLSLIRENLHHVWFTLGAIGPARACRSRK